MEIETLNHLFWECIHYSILGLNSNFTGIQCINPIQLKNTMLGITEGTDITEIRIKNFIIMLGKYFFFKIKYQKQHPT